MNPIYDVEVTYTKKAYSKFVPLVRKKSVVERGWGTRSVSQDTVGLIEKH
jgi:hypothetical protein